jgi:hypothetical protein
VLRLIRTPTRLRAAVWFGDVEDVLASKATQAHFSCANLLIAFGQGTALAVETLRGKTSLMAFVD